MQRFAGVCVLLGLMISSVSARGLKTPKKIEPSVHEPVPVPKAPTVKLPESHLHELQKTGAECKAMDTCLEENSGKEDSKALETCILKHLGEKKGSKVWAIYKKAKMPSDKKVSLAVFKSTSPSSYWQVMRVLKEVVNSKAVLLQTDFCAEPKAAEKSKYHVPVPPKTDVKLPSPGPSHQAADPKVKSVADMPPTCGKLDVCLKQIKAEKYEEDFEKCVSNFCKESYKANDFKGKDDPRTQLCDKKGKEAWDILAKAGAANHLNEKMVKLNAMEGGAVPKEVATQMLLSTAAYSETTYSKLLHAIFDKDLSSTQMYLQCETAAPMRPEPEI